MNKSNLLTIIALQVALALPGSAHAGIILFSDNFNTDDGTVWDEEIGGGGTGVNAGSLYFATGTNSPSSQPARAAVKRSVDTTGYENITVSFDYLGYSNNTSTDLLYFAWDLNTNGNTASDEAAWNNIPTGGLFDDSYSSGSLVFSTSFSSGLSGGADNTNLDVMLWLEATGQNKTYRIDNFVIMGDEITANDPDPTGVPVPAVLPLLGTGLVLLGFVGKRRKRLAVQKG